MYKTLGGIVLALLAALALALCTFRAGSGEEADFIFVNGTEPKSLDPHIFTGQPEGRIGDAIFEGLTYRDPKSLRPVPGCAASWTISDDGKTYRFKIRKDAKWSDGTAITAKDFAYSWRRLQTSELGSEYAYIMHMIRGAEEFNAYGNAARHLRGDIRSAFDALAAKHAGASIPIGEWVQFVASQHVTAAVKGTANDQLLDLLARKRGEVTPEEVRAFGQALAQEAESRQAAYEHAKAHFGVDEGAYVDPDDPYTFVVELKAPTPYFLELTAFYPSYPVPQHVVEAEGNADDWFMPDKIVSNGPFTLEEWFMKQRIRLRKSPTYWGRDSIRLDVIDALPIEDTNAALNLFLTRGADWAPGPPSQLVGVLRERPEYRSAPGMVIYYYRLNCTHPALKNPKVRQAIGLAIDRQAIIDGVLKAGQLPAHHMVPPGLAGYEPPASHLGHDPEKARALLAEAGYPGGKGLDAWRLLYNENEAHKQVAEAIADQLKRNLGLKVQPLNKEWQTYQADTMALEYEIARAGWIGDYLDPNTFLDMWVTNGGNNQTGWSDPRYDRLIRFAGDIALVDAADGSWLSELSEPERAKQLLEARQAATDPTAKRKAGERLRMHLFREAEAILFQEAFPILPIYYYVVQSMVQPWVQGWHSELELPDGTKAANVQDIHPLRGISIDASKR